MTSDTENRVFKGITAASVSDGEDVKVGAEDLFCGLNPFVDSLTSRVLNFHDI